MPDLMRPNVFLALVLLAHWTPVQGQGEAPLGPAFLRDYAETRGFMLGRPSSAKLTPDGKSVLFLRSGPRTPKLTLHEFNIATRSTRELLTPAQLLQGDEEKLSPEEKARRERMRVSLGGFTSFQLSKDGGHILLSLSGKLYLYERASGKVTELRTSPGTLLDPKFSPDGRSVAYVLDHDVHVLDLRTSRERPVTKGGTDLVRHGEAEFIAMEELDRSSGYWWSPDSKFIVYEEASAEGVEVWHVFDPAKPEAAPHPFYYPRPGKPNVKVRFGIVPVRGGKTVWIQWDAERYPYVSQVRWEAECPLTLTVLTRDQQELVLLAADPKSGETTPLVTERNPAWVNYDQDVPHWLEDGSGFLWTSEQAAGPQLELRRKNGALLRVIVPSGSGYQGLVHLDDGRREVVYRASADPTQSHLHRISLDGGTPAQLTHEPGTHAATFGKDGALHIRSTSPAGQMPKTSLHRADGSLVSDLPSAAESPAFKPRVEVLKAGPGEGFYAKIVRPQNFDPSKRYPVINYVYGGPHFTIVRATMGSHLLNQWLADQGFIVVSIDNRGTPGRGLAWERAIYKNFGSVPLDDQVAGLKALGERFPEMDLERVGIAGWSFGGYMSGLAVLRRPDIFKAGVAGAPVTDWPDYDSCYTERYLGTPETDPAVYREASLLTYASELSRPLLLLHGTTDDNVYFRHSLKLADALFRAGKRFEILPLSGLTHMVPDAVVTERLWSRIAAHFKEHLGGPT